MMLLSYRLNGKRGLIHKDPLYADVVEAVAEPPLAAVPDALPRALASALVGSHLQPQPQLQHESLSKL